MYFLERYMLKKTPGQKKQILSSVLQLLCCALVLVFLHGMKYFLYALCERTCVLCESQPYHNLCLVDLEQGDIYELTVYDPNPISHGELSNLQSEGVFSFISVGDLVGYRNTASHSIHINIPAGSGTMQPFDFCSDCGDLLENDFSLGYMLADLSDPTQHKVYPLIDGAVYQVRCYEASVIFNPEKDQWEVAVFGKLNHTE